MKYTFMNTIFNLSTFNILLLFAPFTYHKYQPERLKIQIHQAFRLEASRF